jgi:predicted MFS family arabinose efflux permease
MQWTAALALLANAWFFFESGIDVRAAFAGIIILGAVLGVTDILLFIRVEEPPVRRLPEPKLWDTLAGPFRQRDFRTFILYSCFWYLAAMVGAPFISMYLLEYVGMDLFHVLMLWTISWVGGAVLSHRLGLWAELFGQRPVLILCTTFKSLNMMALLVCPPDPTLAFWILTPVFMIDAFLNAGITIANNGFMIKNSPRENRTMFIASGTALAGMVGGLTSILAGALIAQTENWSLDLYGWRCVNFHLLFAISVVLRLMAVVLATWVREPSSSGTRYVVMELVTATRLRVRSIALISYWRRDEPRTGPLAPAKSKQPVSTSSRRADREILCPTAGQHSSELSD